MKNLIPVVIVVVVVLAIVLMFTNTPSGPGSAAKQTRFVTIGTGGISGVYYPTGGAIAKMVNRKRSEHGLRATVESTGGSVFNINAILAGDLDFGIAQSDRQYQAVHGLSEWKGQSKPGLRAVFSIHPETVILVAADEAGIGTVQDLKGKTVNIGNPGSGQRQNAIDALTNAGIDHEKDLTAESVKAAEAPSLLQDGRIDAFFYTVGNPSGAIKEATAGKRKVHFVPLEGAEKLVEKYPYYAQAKIPVKSYPAVTNKEDVSTFGVKATFVTSAKTADDIVYIVTKEVFDNIEEFKTLHPAYASLTRESMLEGLTAPIHPGALKYFKEAGLK